MLLDFAILIIAAVALAKSSVALVESLTRIALKLKISEYMVGFILMAVATSLPEFFIGVVSAIEGRPTFSLGNVIGSNIADPTIILGLAVLIAGGLRVQTNVRNKEIFYTALSAAAPLIMLLDGNLDRIEGVILLLFFAIYVYTLLFQSREYTKVITNHREARPLALEFTLFGFELLVLLVSSKFLIQSSEVIATALRIPSILIGIFVLALGTSLPELAFTIPAAKKRQGAMVMGNILGSIVTNATLVLGVTAIIRPIAVERPDIFLTSAGVLVLTLIIFSFFVWTEYRVTAKEALALILGYLVFVISQLLFGA